MKPEGVIEEEVLDAYRAPKLNPRGWYAKERWPMIRACLPVDG